VLREPELVLALVPELVPELALVPGQVPHKPLSRHLIVPRR